MGHPNSSSGLSLGTALLEVEHNVRAVTSNGEAAVIERGARTWSVDTEEESVTAGVIDQRQSI
jgi:hypothetical protein